MFFAKDRLREKGRGRGSRGSEREEGKREEERKEKVEREKEKEREGGQLDRSGCKSSSSSAIDSRAGQIFSPVDATKPAVQYRSSAEPNSLVARSAPCGRLSGCSKYQEDEAMLTPFGVLST